jgi:hypothetical protein
MTTITTVSRAQMVAAAAVVTPGTAAALSAPDSGDDPVFAAIERHRQATQVWLAALDDANAPDTINIAAEAGSDAALDHVYEAFLAWLTTPPTTMAGAIATLEHASRHPYEAAGEAFPAMIAQALRKIATDKLQLHKTPSAATQPYTGSQ